MTPAGSVVAREALGTELLVATVGGPGAVRLLYPNAAAVAGELATTGPTDPGTRCPSGGTP